MGPPRGALTRLLYNAQALEHSSVVLVFAFLGLGNG